MTQSKVNENLTEAILVTDKKNRIVAVNPAFEEITGYTEEEVLGKNPKLLASGKHDQPYYQQMWQSINKKGEWQGEIWNRRKNGELFPEWLNISTIKDTRGKVKNYIAIFSDISKRKENEAKLYKLAHYDHLTQVANRSLFTMRLEHAIINCQGSGKKIALFFLDLDRFKFINDTFGHTVGDQLLQMTAQRLQSCLTKKDTLARLGGDEFTIILPEIEREEEAISLAEKIISCFAKPFIIDNHSLSISSSIGIAFFPEDGATVDQLLTNADTAMYRAKKRGNVFQFYHPSFDLVE